MATPWSLYLDAVRWSNALHGAPIGVMSAADLDVGLGLIAQAEFPEAAWIHVARTVLAPAVKAWVAVAERHPRAVPSWSAAPQTVLALVERCFDDPRSRTWTLARLEVLNALTALPVAPPAWVHASPTQWPASAAADLCRLYSAYIPTHQVPEPPPRERRQSQGPPARGGRR